MPAAAVTPAPIAYINAVAVKKLVVEFWSRCRLVRLEGEYRRSLSIPGVNVYVALTCHISWEVRDSGVRGLDDGNGRPFAPAGSLATFHLFHFEKIGVFKAGLRSTVHFSMG